MQTTKTPLLLFGGPYSNLHSLEALKRIAEAKGFLPEQIICTGDILGYCAQPEETVQAIREWGIRSICGNVEIQLREGAADCGCDFSEGGACDMYSKTWYPFAQSRLSKESMAYIASLPEQLRLDIAGKSAVVVHGSHHETAEFIFRSTPWSVKERNFIDAEADIIIAGHCGLPFSEEKEGRLWLNPGVIGMPANDGQSNVWYALLEVDALRGELTVTHEHYTYDHQSAAHAMRANGLPEAYALTLETGLWDNCEILPAEETAAQGKKIEVG